MFVVNFAREFEGELGERSEEQPYQPSLLGRGRGRDRRGRPYDSSQSRGFRNSRREVVCLSDL